MLSLCWLKTIALTPASCPADPFLAPRGSCAHTSALPPRHITAGHPHSPCCQPSTLSLSQDTRQMHRSCGVRTGAPQRVPPLPAFPVCFTHPTAPSCRCQGSPDSCSHPRPVRTVSSLPLLLPLLGASPRAALPGAAVDSDFHQDFDN